MRIIKVICDQIKDELCGAEEYIQDAFKYQSNFPELSRIYFDLSNTEMNHANELHKQAVNLIEKKKREEDLVIPEYMEEIWEEKHEKMLKEMAEIKTLIGLYKP